MERLWSPWRSKYIDSFKDANATDGCVFCTAIGSDNDAALHLVHRGATAFVIMNLYPYNNGHLLIVPNRHVAQLDLLSSEEHRELMDLIAFGVSLLRESLAPHGFNIGANLGRVAGAGIEDHLHFHIVPRWNGDTNFMPVLAETKMISEEMEVTYDRLIAAKTRVAP